jgi:hypothetical protein
VRLAGPRETSGVTPARLLCCVLLMALLPASVLRAASDPDDSASLRAWAIGGRHVATADGLHTLAVNPAGIPFARAGFTFSAVGLHLTGPVFTIAGVVLDGLASGDFATALGSAGVQNLLQGVYARALLTGPIAFGYVGRGLAAGITNTTSLIVEGTANSQIEIRAREVLRAASGYALQIPLPDSWQSMLSVGVGGSVYLGGDAVTEASLITLPAVLSSIGSDFLAQSPFELTLGFAIDAGILYRWRDVLSFGIAVTDIYAPFRAVPYATVSGFLGRTAEPGAAVWATRPINLSLGVECRPSLGRAERVIQDLSVTLDYRDALDFWLDPARADNIILKFGLGVECTLLHVLALRAGFSRGLFAGGLGVDLGPLLFDATMFGWELSSEPGLRPVYNLALGLEFRQ